MAIAAHSIKLVARFIRVGTLVGAVLALAFAVCSGALATGIKVIVNDAPISQYDIDQRMRFIALTTRQQPSEQLRKEALEELINEHLQLHEGEKLNITVDDAEVDQALQSMAQRNNMDAAKLTAAFAQAGVHIATLKNRIRATIVWQRVVRQKFRYDVMLMRENLERVQDTADGPASTRLQLQQVRLAVPSNAGDAAIAQRLAEAERVRASFESCESLGSLVAKVSGATVRNLGETSPAELAPGARTLLLNAKVGQMTPPNMNGNMIELYAVCGKKTVSSGSTKSEGAAKEQMQEEFEKRAVELLAELRQQALIEYR